VAEPPGVRSDEQDVTILTKVEPPDMAGTV
jgi:hypothetical protein